MNQTFVRKSGLLSTRRVSNHVDTCALLFTKVWFTSFDLHGPAVLDRHIPRRMNPMGIRMTEMLTDPYDRIS